MCYHGDDLCVVSCRIAGIKARGIEAWPLCKIVWIIDNSTDRASSKQYEQIFEFIASFELVFSSYPITGGDFSGTCFLARYIASREPSTTIYYHVTL